MVKLLRQAINEDAPHLILPEGDNTGNEKHHGRGTASKPTQARIALEAVATVRSCIDRFYLLASAVIRCMRVPPLACWCFFPGVFFSSRVNGACPVTTVLIMRVNARTTTTTYYCSRPGALLPCLPSPSCFPRPRFPSPPFAVSPTHPECVSLRAFLRLLLMPPGHES